MADKEKTTGKQKKGSWFEGLRAEFNKIIWTDKNTLVKQTVAVVVITVILGVIISVFDSAILHGFNLVV